MQNFSDIERGDAGISSYQGSAGGGATTYSSPQNKQLQHTQAQVDQVVDIMKNNMEKVLQRDEKLTDLDNRADQLQCGAQQFQTTATRIKRKYWWQNLKMMLILGGIIAVIIVIIIVLGMKELIGTHITSNY